MGCTDVRAAAAEVLAAAEAASSEADRTGVQRAQQRWQAAGVQHAAGELHAAGARQEAQARVATSVERAASEQPVAAVGAAAGVQQSADLIASACLPVTGVQQAMRPVRPLPPHARASLGSQPRTDADAEYVRVVSMLRATAGHLPETAGHLPENCDLGQAVVRSAAGGPTLAPPRSAATAIARSAPTVTSCTAASDALGSAAAGTPHAPATMTSRTIGTRTSPASAAEPFPAAGGRPARGVERARAASAGLAQGAGQEFRLRAAAAPGSSPLAPRSPSAATLRSPAWPPMEQQELSVEEAHALTAAAAESLREVISPRRADVTSGSSQGAAVAAVGWGRAKAEAPRPPPNHRKSKAQLNSHPLTNINFLD